MRRPSLFFFQAEDGIRDLVRSRGLGDVYKRQGLTGTGAASIGIFSADPVRKLSLELDGVDLAGFLSLIHI